MKRTLCAQLSVSPHPCWSPAQGPAARHLLEGTIQPCPPRQALPVLHRWLCDIRQHETKPEWGPGIWRRLRQERMFRVIGRGRVEKAEPHWVPQMQTGCHQVTKPRAGGWAWGQAGKT